MTLSAAQQQFVRDIARLIDYADELGYALTFGDAYRSPKAFGGMGEEGPYGRTRSAHKQRLAVDFNLFIDGRYRSDSAAHEPLGMFWEGLTEGNVWGGRFNDGNHYSHRYNGIA